MTHALEIEDLTLRFGGVRALEDVSFAIATGKIGRAHV